MKIWTRKGREKAALAAMADTSRVLGAFPVLRPQEDAPTGGRAPIRHPSTARQDLAWILGLSAGLFVLFARMDVFERYRTWIRVYHLSAWEADDAVFVVVWLALAFGVFSCRRLRELRLEIQLRRKAERLKDEFLAMVSHELLTPLTTIREGVSQVQDGLLGEVTERQRQWLGLALEDADRLTRLIRDLLDMARIQQGQVPRHQERLDMGAVARQVGGLYEPLARAKGLDLRLEVREAPLPVVGDRDLLVQIWSNLVGNALKFTSSGGIILRVLPEGDQVLCEVEDTGPGIAEADQSRIFGKFVQVNRAQGPGSRGLGLGLALAKAMVESHGGSLSLSSAPARGSVFRFVLPRSPL